MLPSPQMNLSAGTLAAGMPPLRMEDAKSLDMAFAWFSDAAASLERSYAELQVEVSRLRAALETKDAELQAERETARRVQALADMSGVLAHEIRNPLASMELFAGLLLECGGLSPEAHDWAAQMQAGIRTLAATVNNVLQLHADREIAKSRVHLANVLAMSLEFLEPVARQHGVELLLNAPVDLQIDADPHRVQQIILNLAMNAFRAMPSGGHLHVSASLLDRTRAEVRVTDDGRGIPAEHLPKIFDTGFTTRPGSVGLGLAVCRKLMEQHGGSIRAESAPDKGATFILEFPLA